MKHIEEPIRVHCAGARPLAFRREGKRGRAYVVERILRSWIVQTAWWAAEVHHTYYEVVADGGVYLICCRSRIRNAWSLLGIHD